MVKQALLACRKHALRLVGLHDFSVAHVSTRRYYKCVQKNKTWHIKLCRNLLLFFFSLLLNQHDLHSCSFQTRKLTRAQQARVLLRSLIFFFFLLEENYPVKVQYANKQFPELLSHITRSIELNLKIKQELDYVVFA